jgi:general secretion pathway protein G
MTNAEARRNDKNGVIRSHRWCRLRHSGFVIDSSFVIRHSSFACRLLRRHPAKARSSSFRAEGAMTIIEMLVVIMIILILAALILAASNYVQTKGARARAETEIAAMSAALESYKADNGIYPFTAATNSLAADQTNPNTSAYKTASLDLYKALTGDQDANGSTDTNQKSYFNFKPQMLAGNRDANGNLTSITYIKDPFGNSYGYSTSKNPIANPSGYTSAAGYNPTFDLWSAGSTASPTPTPPAGWIKNW